MPFHQFTRSFGTRVVLFRHHTLGNKWLKRGLFAAGLSIASAAILFNCHGRTYLEAPPITGQQRQFSKAEVSKHKSKEDGGIWVTYRGGVYDITEFVAGHPGGEKILLAAGGPVEPFWKVYNIHQKQEVADLLEQYRIGDLEPSPIGAAEKEAVQVDDPFVNDPDRSPILVVRSQKPFNAETPLSMLADYFLTPNEIFYKRSHLPIPDLKPDEYRLEISGEGLESSHQFSLLDLQTKFPKTEITATLQCAGNRRQEMYAAGPVAGLAWEGGAIGNAKWTGVRLSDVLKQCGITENIQAEHIQFDGADGYGASVPLDKVFSRTGDVLLVFEMNGEPLPREHGYPVRVLIPGHVAARSVKWVNKITLANEESHSHWQRNDYKGFSPSSNWDKLDWDSAASIQEMPVQSGILEPSNNSSITTDLQTVTLKGYAWSGGGRSVLRVDVSGDGGKTWHVAKLLPPPDDIAKQKNHQHWSWTQWECEIPVESAQKPGEQVEFVCKAVDSSYNVQPNQVDGIYNKRGVLSNAWHRIKINRVSEE